MASSAPTTTSIPSLISVRPQPSSAAFTLLELMVVMVLIGIVAGVGMSGFDRIEPGRSSMQAAVENFIESSRDRARASNQNVVVSLRPETEQESARWQRMVFRNVFEATFESAAAVREQVFLSGQSQLQVAGRLGACLDLSEGGMGAINGRGTPDLSNGFVLDFDCFPADVAEGNMLTWPGVVSIKQLRNGVLQCQVRAGDGEFFSNITIDSPPAALRALRWQHLRLIAANGQCQLQIDGKPVASTILPKYLSVAQDVPAFGDIDRVWYGKIDEFYVQALQTELGPVVPGDVQMLLSQPTIVFNRFGALDASHSENVLIRVETFGELLSNFIIGRFSQEVAE